MYSVGELVWAKSSLPREIFWPAKVVESDNGADDCRRKKPVIAHVNFLADNTHEAIRNASNVIPFNNDRKEFLLKKGRRLKDQMQRLLFESAVKEAESCIELHEGRKKNAQNKRILDSSMQTDSPRTRRSMLFDEEKYSERSESVSQVTATALNKFESKSSAFSRGKNKKSTDSKDATKDIAESASMSTKRDDSDKREVIISKKSCRVTKAKDKITSKETSNLKPNVRTSWNLRKNKHESDQLDFDLKESENKVKDLGGRYTEMNSNEPGMKESCETCLTKRGKGKDDSKTPKQNRRIRLKSNIKALLRTKRDSSKKTKSYEVQTLNKTFNTNLDAIPEERESEVDETARTPREKHQQKRVRNEFETNESLGKNSTELSPEKKKLRLNLCGERNRTNYSHAYEVEGPFSTENLVLKTEEDFSRQSTATDSSVSESLSNLSSGKTTTIQSSNETKHSLKDEKKFMGSLGTASCRCNENGLRNLGSDVVKIEEDRSIPTEATEEKSGDYRNEKNVENMAAKEDGAHTKENELEENVADDSSSDEDCFPEAFSPSHASKKVFSPGDVVWAKYRKHPFWPAQISRADNKHKGYYYVKFFPKSDCRSIRMGKVNIISFTEDQERFKSQDMDTKSREQFDEAIKQAEDILYRRVFQKDEILPEEIEDPNSELSDDGDERSTPANAERDKLVGEPDKPVEKPVADESGVSTSDMEILSPELTGNGRSQRRRKQVSRYSNILHELHRCKKRLLDIYHEKVESTRHKTFRYGTATEKNKLKRLASFGPIHDDETQEAIIRQLKTWYDEETKATSITLDYLFDVWLPEAIVYYIELTDNVYTEEAEKLFLDQAKHVDKREVREDTARLKTKTIDKPTMQATVERAKQRLLYNLTSP